MTKYVTIRLLTWNVNGIRAILQQKKQNLSYFLDDLNADIICFQETKLTRSELDVELAKPTGYNAYYSFSKVRNGYSGVVTYCKLHVSTIAAEEGLIGRFKVKNEIGHLGNRQYEYSTQQLTDLDSEGRCVITDHDGFILINTYCPAARDCNRIEFKLAFHDLLQDRVRALQNANKAVIVVGDINVSHKRIDASVRDEYRCYFEDSPSRRWMDTFVYDMFENVDESAGTVAIETGKLVDIYRYFHPTQKKAFTCWSTVTSARATNFGARIDYILIDPRLVQEGLAIDADIEPDRMGSDHCPVRATLSVKPSAKVSLNNGSSAPALCAKYYPEFSGKQQTLRSYFVPSTLEVIGKASIEKSPLNGKKRNRESSQKTLTSFFTPKQAVKKNRTAVEQLVTVDTGETNTEAEISRLVNRIEENSQQQLKWQQMLTGRAPETPLCRCGVPTVLRSVLKVNDNWGRKFYVCSKPEGEKTDPNSRCDFFQWVDKKKKNQKDV